MRARLPRATRRDEPAAVAARDLDQRGIGLHRLREAEDGVALHPRRKRLRRNERLRQRLPGERDRASKRHSPLLVVDAHVVTPLRRGIDGRPADLVFLRRERERVLVGLLDLHGLADGLEPADRLARVLELLRVERQVVEVGPPLRPPLATVVVEELREEPARPPHLGVGEELVAHAVALLLSLDGLLFLLLRLARNMPWQVGPQPEEPAVEPERREAVLFVVGGDALEERALPGLEPGLEVEDGLAPAVDLRLADEAVELLHPFDRVAGHRSAERLLRHAEEVDEHLAAQEVVHLLLARPVLAREARERGALVLRIVVDVHAGEAPAAFDEVVDELLEGAPLLVPVAGPDGAVELLAVLRELDPAEEELEPPAGLVPGVALEVEPDVARRRLRHEVEAAVVLLREEVDLVLARLAVVLLEGSLVAEALEGGGTHTRDIGLGARFGEGGERVDVGLRKPL